MKKLVLVAAMFMFVCGGSLLVKAQDPVKTEKKTEQCKDSTVVKEDTQAKDSTTAEPVKKWSKQHLNKSAEQQ